MKNNQTLKEHYKERLFEAIRGDVTPRSRQTLMRKVRGIDRKSENRVTPIDNPVYDIADPRNRAMLRAEVSDLTTGEPGRDIPRFAALGRAMDSAINAEFGMPKYPIPRA